ncbi:IS21 family transposase [Chitinophaga sp. S165]|uniref:IS21 family transposase n=1 Tax=Chitinophaga sp. S165 TaxID=2135462 RepID=UPI000D70A386|nr:IS21 family transposase [Chitinophaga sp. S165]PWV44400.1 transposase [Chitinophaga sp. S165]
MAGETISMTKLKQIFLHRRNGMALEAIARVMNISRNTVKKYIRLAEQKGLELEQLAAMEEHDLEKIFAEPTSVGKSRFQDLEGMFGWMEQELKRTGVTRWLLWAEYKSRYPDGYAYTQFCDYYRHWLEHRSATMHFDHTPADKAYIDFTGKRLQVVDRDGGEVREVEIYVCILGFSQLTYVEALNSQRKEDFLQATANSLKYFGGVPKALVTDNLKSAVTEPDNYEPEINESFLEFGNHYQTTIYPTRSRKPKDKALVESAVNIVYKRIFAPLRDKIFFELHELNIAILELLNKHNNEMLHKEPFSRRQKFDQHEAALLQPLPTTPYQLRKYKIAKVMKNSHIQLEKHYYSVPYRFIGKEVKAIYTRDQVHIFINNERIAFHIRGYKPFGYTTDQNHLPSSHQFVADWKPEKFLSWADSISPQVRNYIETILQQKKYPEQAYRSCVGILSLAKKAGKERLIKAIERASFYQIYNYKTVKKILDGGLEMLFEPDSDQSEASLPQHTNIRGKEHYQ